MKNNYLPFILVFALIVSSIQKVHSQSTLSPGDIAFVGFQSKDPDQFSFVALTDIGASTQIHITENGWLTTGGLRSGEGIIIWQSPSETITAGEVINFTKDGSWVINEGTIIEEHYSFRLAEGGDQLLAFQVSAANDTTFITAINFNGDSWNENENSTNSSDIPRGLTNLKNAVAVIGNANGVYSGPTKGTVSFLRAAINHPDNWTTSNSILSGWPDSFTLSDTIVIDTQITVSNINLLSYELLEINSVGSLTVVETLQNSGLIKIFSGNTGTGILNAADISGAGTASVELFIPDYNWHIISSPVAGQDMAAFASTTPLETDPDGETTSYDLAPYNEASNTWGPYFPQSGGSGFLSSGEGYALRLSDNSGVNILFSGTLQSDTVKKSLSLTPPTGLGWHALGNPYTAPIMATSSSGDGKSFLEKNKAKLNSLFTAVYTWNDNLATPGWETYNSTSDFNLAMGQGFVVCTAADGNELYFDNSMKTSQAATFKSEQIPWQKIKLVAQQNGVASSTQFAFRTGMTNGLDISYDAGLFERTPDLQLCSRLLDDMGADIAIQALPAISEKTQRIPLVVYTSESGEINFSIEKTTTDSVTTIILEDDQNGIFQELNKQTPTYSCTVKASEPVFGRFYLVVGKLSATAIKCAKNDSFNAYSFDKTIYINQPFDKKTLFKLISIDGKTLLTKKAQPGGGNKLNAQGLKTGIYILQAINNQKVQSLKIYLE